MLERSCYHRGSYNESIPRLCVNNVVPNNSWVFQYVRWGEVSVLQGLLRQGRASLRDHDESSASLLFVSTVLPLSYTCASQQIFHPA